MNDQPIYHFLNFQIINKNPKESIVGFSRILKQNDSSAINRSLFVYFMLCGFICIIVMFNDSGNYQSFINHLLRSSALKEVL